MRHSEFLIIGIGNPLRGDDGVGHHVAARVARRWPDKTRSLSVHQLTPELVDVIAAACGVVFVDADATSDGVTCRRVQVVEMGAIRSHRLGPQELIALARRLGNAVPEAWVVAVPAPLTHYSEALSHRAIAAADQAAALIDEIIASRGVA